MKGIYMLTMEGKSYVGKDSDINSNKRFKHHLWALKSGIHHCKEMQEIFNSKGRQSIEYKVLEHCGDCSDEYLCEREKFHIAEQESYTKGFNQTIGGVGMRGYILSEEEIKARSERTRGEFNPQAKLTNEQFYEMVRLFKEGKTNNEISEIYGVHSRYISLIRHKKRFKHLWETVDDYNSEISDGQRRSLDFEGFTKVVRLINDGHTNASIEREFGLSSGTVSRIRNRRLYIRYWDKLERSTTSQTA